MRILSLNAWGGRLAGRLLPYLVAADPDMICLQEVVHAPAAAAAWLEYRDGGVTLPQRADLFRELVAALPAHRAYWCPAARGELFDGTEPVPSEWGLATFVRTDRPVIGQAQDFVHGAFSASGWGEHPRARNAHVVRLFDPLIGAPVVVAHLHGLRDPAGKEDTPAREAQAAAFIALIQGLRRAGERLVACGDFNLLPSSATFAALRGIGLSDLVVAGGHRDTRTSFYGKPGRFADYMLVSPEVAVRRFEVVEEPEVSDHRALLLDLG